MTVSYNRYSKDFKIQAVKLANVIGVKETAATLDIPYATLYKWYRLDKEKAARFENNPPSKTAVETDILAYINAISGVGAETEHSLKNYESNRHITPIDPIHTSGICCETEPTEHGRVIRIYLE